MSGPRRKVAILFRYGAGEHVDFLPALPEIVAQFHRRGVAVHHFGFKGNVPLPEDLKLKMRVQEGPFKVNRRSERDKHLKAILWLMWLPFLGRKLQREGFERVFVDETLPLSAALLQWGYHGKLAFTVHDFFMEIYGEQNRFMQWVSRRVHPVDLKSWRKLDRVFTRVASAKAHLVEEGLLPDRLVVVPDPVNLELFQPEGNEARRQLLRAGWGVLPEDLLLVHHGVMHPNKGNLRLVEAVARLRERLPQLKLLLIGEGPELKALRRAVTEMNLASRVILSGWLPGLPEIAAALSAADIGLVMRKGLPGDHFHVTSTLVHNLACGLPVLAARLAGIAELVEEGVQGYLFDPVCGEEFDTRLIQLAEDAVRLQQMGAAARELAVQRFNPRTIAGVYTEWMCT